MLDTHSIELLQPCKWLEDTKNLLITSSAGAGKTYIANTLCFDDLQQHKTVKYIRASTLLQESEKARLNAHTYDYVNQMTGYNVLVIDDFGLMELDMDKCRDLLKSSKPEKVKILQ